MRQVRNVSAVLFLAAMLVSPAQTSGRGQCGPQPEPECVEVATRQCQYVGSGCYIASTQETADEEEAQELCEIYLQDVISTCSVSVDATPQGQCDWYCQIESPTPMK